MRVEHLAYLVEVDSCRSMSRAARSLFLTQPALSAAIGALEEELGFALFTRSHLGVTPTENGRRVIREARDVLAVVEGWKEIPRLERRIEETVRLVAPGAVCNAVLSDLVIALNQRYPALEVQVHRSNASVVEYLSSGRFFAGITGAAPEEEAQAKAFAGEAEYAMEYLCADRFCVFLSTAHPMAGKACLERDDLKDMALALLSHAELGPYPPALERVAARCVLWLSSNEDILAAVEKNVAFSFVPALAGALDHRVLAGRVRMMDIRGLPMPYRHYLLYPAERKLSRGEEIVLQAVREAAGKQERLGQGRVRK